MARPPGLKYTVCLGPVSRAYRALDAHTTYWLRRWLCKKHKAKRVREKRRSAGRLGYRYLVRRNATRFFSWLLGLLLAVWLTGFFLSVPFFIFVYLKFQAREECLLSLALTAATFVFLVDIFELIRHVSRPQPLVPWPEAILNALLPQRV